MNKQLINLGGKIKITQWNPEALNGYKPFTTFWADFCIAEAFGVKAVKDTFKACLRGWGDNIQYFTELVLVLNHKLWEHYGRGNKALARAYDEIWREAVDYVYDNFSGEDLQYYRQVTD